LCVVCCVLCVVCCVLCVVCCVLCVVCCVLCVVLSVQCEMRCVAFNLWLKALLLYWTTQADLQSCVSLHSHSHALVYSFK
jgi:hypothetical protein